MQWPRLRQVLPETPIAVGGGDDHVMSPGPLRSSWDVSIGLARFDLESTAGRAVAGSAGSIRVPL